MQTPKQLGESAQVIITKCLVCFLVFLMFEALVASVMLFAPAPDAALPLPSTQQQLALA
jgi:hypothetical protein